MPFPWRKKLGNDKIKLLKMGEQESSNGFRVLGQIHLFLAHRNEADNKEKAFQSVMLTSS